MTKKHGNQKDTSHNIGFAIWRGKFLVELVRIFCNFGKNRKIGNSLAPHRKAVSRYTKFLFFSIAYLWINNFKYFVHFFYRPFWKKYFILIIFIILLCRVSKLVTHCHPIANIFNKIFY